MLSDHAQRRAGLAHVLVALLLVGPSLYAGSAVAQGIPGEVPSPLNPEIEIKSFGLRSGDKDVTFVENGSTYTLHLLFSNHGGAGNPLNDSISFPIFVLDMQRASNESSPIIWCYPGKIGRGDHKVPARASPIRIKVPEESDASKVHQLRIIANIAPGDAAWPADLAHLRLSDFKKPEGCPASVKEPGIGTKTAPLIDNVARYYFVPHSKPNLVVERIWWCKYTLSDSSPMVRGDDGVHRPCSSDQETWKPGIDPEEYQDEHPWNRTRYSDTFETDGGKTTLSYDTHFGIDVINHPTATWRPGDKKLPNYNDCYLEERRENKSRFGVEYGDWGNCHGFNYTFKISVKNTERTLSGVDKQSETYSTLESITYFKTNKKRGEYDPQTVGFFRGGANWSLFGKAGNYSVSVQIDTSNVLPETSEFDNSNSTHVDVKAADLEAQISRTGLKTDPKDPYKYDGGIVKIPVTFNVNNTGNYRAINDSNQHQWNATIYLDAVSNTSQKFTFDFDFLAAGGSVTKTVEFVGTKSKIHPGQHKLILIVDHPAWAWTFDDADKKYETCGNFPDCAGRGFVFERGGEWFGVNWTLSDDPRKKNSNNFDVVKVYVEDKKAPDLSELKVNGETDPVTRLRGQWINLSVVVEDDDTFDAHFVLTSPTGKTTNLTRLTRLNSTSDEYYFNKTDGLLELGAYKVKATAKDTSGNVANLTWGSTLTINPWPVQTKEEGKLLLEPGNNTIFTWDVDRSVAFTIDVSGNETGIHPSNSTTGKYLDLLKPGRKTWERYEFGSDQHCTGSKLPPPPPIPDLPQQPPKTPIEECTGVLVNSTIFKVGVSREDVGNYYALVNVSDVSGAVRTVHRAWRVQDKVPFFPDDENVTLNSSVDPAEKFNITAKVEDDTGVKSVYAKFTRTDGKYSTNVTLRLVDGDEREGTWKADLVAGFGKNITHAGKYVVNVAALDDNGNWGHFEIKPETGKPESGFNVNDTRGPTLVASATGVKPALQEVEGNVTFFAKASDDTAFTVSLNAYLGNELKFNATLADPDKDGNYTFTRQMNEAGTFSYLIEVVDSASKKATPYRGTLTVKDNLPPRYEVRSPKHVVDGKRFAGPNPKIQVLVYDNDGVDDGTIQLAVNGANVTAFSLLPSTSPKGYLLTYDIPPTQRFNHNQLVNVTLHAVDASVKRLESNESFTFRVDATPPTSRVVVEEMRPKFRASENDLWTVGPDTLFVLAAEDNDMDVAGRDYTKARTIQYQLWKAAGGALNVYTRPFSIKEAQDVYTGNGTYVLRYWATDDVDNREREKSFLVNLDPTPPILDPFGALPTGRFVNATFYEETGVERAVVWWRFNKDAYAALPMTDEDADGVWSAVIPEGKRGDIVSYYLQAWDRVNNTATFGNASKPYGQFPVGNHLPTLRLLEPETGARVRGIVPIRWDAEDKDGDALSFVVYYRLVGRTTYVELAKLPAGTARYAFDTTKLPDGTYDLQVTATDGNFVALAQARVSIVNSATPLENPSVSKDVMRPGEPFLITAKVTKAGAKVKAVLFLDGKEYAQVDMHDDGRDGDVAAGDGIYSALVTVDDAGDYTVEITAEYEEDNRLQSKTIKDAAAFTVKLTAADVLQRNGGLWVAIAVVAIACLGVGGYALTRNWRKE